MAWYSRTTVRYSIRLVSTALPLASANSIQSIPPTPRRFRGDASQLPRTTCRAARPTLGRGLAWSNSDATTVIRGGYGLFYDQLPVSGIAQLMFNRPTPSNFTNPQAIYGQSFLSPTCGAMGQCGMGNSSLVSIDPNQAASQAASVPFGISAINAQQFRSPRSQQVDRKSTRLNSSH